MTISLSCEGNLVGEGVLETELAQGSGWVTVRFKRGRGILHCGLWVGKLFPSLLTRNGCIIIPSLPTYTTLAASKPSGEKTRAREAQSSAGFEPVPRIRSVE